MNPNNHLADVQEIKRINAQQRWLLIGLTLLLLLLAMKNLAKEHTVVLEPPVRDREISVTGGRVDGAWLEEMGIHIAHMMLDATPHSIEWQQAQVLRWTHPAMHGELEQRMTTQAKRLKDSNAATVFWPQQVAPDPDRQRVLMLGRLETMVNGVRTSSDTVAYQAEFESKGGRMLLKDWKEVPTDDPWLEKAAQAAARAERSKK